MRLKNYRTISGWLCLLSIAGCTIREARYDGPPPPRDNVVFVQPGYYYDGDYYDNYGVYHPRAVYYYDGNHWDHRDHVPQGYVMHDRGGYDHGGGRGSMMRSHEEMHSQGHGPDHRE